MAVLITEQLYYTSVCSAQQRLLFWKDFRRKSGSLYRKPGRWLQEISWRKKAFLSVIKPAQCGVKRTPGWIQTTANGPPDYNIKPAVCLSVTRSATEGPGRNQNQALTDGRNRWCSLRHRRGGVCVCVAELACYSRGQGNVYARNLMSVAGQQVPRCLWFVRSDAKTRSPGMGQKRASFAAS